MESGRPRISLDVDGVLADVNTPWLQRHNQRAGTTYQFQDMVDWGFRGIGSTTAEMMPLYDLVWNEDWPEVRCLASSSLIGALAEIAHVDLVTSRTTATMQSLRRWLQSHGISNLNIILNEQHRSKADLDYDIYIDDDPRLAAAIADRPKQRLLLVDQPWNRTARTAEDEIGPANVHRVKNTDEALVMAIFAELPAQTLDNRSHIDLAL